jgi:hypothetical protein
MRQMLDRWKSVGRLALGFPCSKNLLPAPGELNAACNRDAVRHASETESDAARKSRPGNGENFVNLQVRRVVAAGSGDLD